MLYGGRHTVNRAWRYQRQLPVCYSASRQSAGGYCLEECCFVCLSVHVCLCDQCLRTNTQKLSLQIGGDKEVEQRRGKAGRKGAMRGEKGSCRNGAGERRREDG